MEIAIKRIYAPYAPDDGWRVLIDRLWPRGLSHDDAMLDDWHKEFAPSTALRQWFAHDANKWQEFKTKYIAELDTQKNSIEAYARTLQNHSHVTFLYAAHDESHNNAVVFSEYLKNYIYPG